MIKTFNQEEELKEEPGGEKEEEDKEGEQLGKTWG